MLFYNGGITIEIPKITEVSIEQGKKSSIIAGESFVNIYAKVLLEQLPWAKLYDIEEYRLVDADGNLLFASLPESDLTRDNYFLNYTGEQLENFVQEVLGIEYT